MECLDFFRPEKHAESEIRMNFQSKKHLQGHSSINCKIGNTEINKSYYRLAAALGGAEARKMGMLAYLDSNQDRQNQNLLYYHYTIGQSEC